MFDSKEKKEISLADANAIAESAKDKVLNALTKQIILLMSGFFTIITIISFLGFQTLIKMEVEKRTASERAEMKADIKNMNEVFVDYYVTRAFISSIREELRQRKNELRPNVDNSFRSGLEYIVTLGYFSYPEVLRVAFEYINPKEHVLYDVNNQKDSLSFLLSIDEIYNSGLEIPEFVELGTINYKLDKITSLEDSLLAQYNQRLAVSTDLILRYNFRSKILREYFHDLSIRTRFSQFPELEIVEKSHTD